MKDDNKLNLFRHFIEEIIQNDIEIRVYLKPAYSYPNMIYNEHVVVAYSEDDLFDKLCHVGECKCRMCKDMQKDKQLKF